MVEKRLVSPLLEIIIWSLDTVWARREFRRTRAACYAVYRCWAERDAFEATLTP
jgi:hypothetical protein